MIYQGFHRFGQYIFGVYLVHFWLFRRTFLVSSVHFWCLSRTFLVVSAYIFGVQRTFLVFISYTCFLVYALINKAYMYEKMYFLT
ncbi:Uncharacterised protein [[Flavobacterium] thermophilum]|nr:Uncharacterised protein [[Flavobacterium] thermophilum]STO36888.1 Uncharacterised protein [[Flavobacterium] thermophilum]